MNPTEVTVNIPVRDLAAATRWYERILDRSGPDLKPIEGVAEYDMGGWWLQLGEGEDVGGPWVLRFAVADAHAERDRLVGLGVDVDPMVHVEGLVDYCEFSDPDGNRLSLYTELGGADGMPAG
ncbi:VOC family protein [Nocardia sp. CC227C]|uniref:VOC family protein n=1 Tax=Nocardia sp. CC227C TaxID=3044562 RepID=UPI00278C7E4F|nr:VOC family protein [Nocardia sp. CC227C]